VPAPSSISSNAKDRVHPPGPFLQLGQVGRRVQDQPCGPSCSTTKYAVQGGPSDLVADAHVPGPRGCDLRSGCSSEDPTIITQACTSHRGGIPSGLSRAWAIRRHRW
jgi:hypothetical protein